LITAFDFTFVQDEPEHCIALAFQASGHRHVALGSQSEFTTSGSIGSLAPQDRPLKSFFSRGETLSLMIPHSVIQENLESMIGNASTPIEFEPIVDSRNGGGAMLRRTIDIVAAQLAEPESLSAIRPSPLASRSSSSMRCAWAAAQLPRCDRG